MSTAAHRASPEPAGQSRREGGSERRKARASDLPYRGKNERAPRRRSSVCRALGPNLDHGSISAIGRSSLAKKGPFRSGKRVDGEPVAVLEHHHGAALIWFGRPTLQSARSSCG